MTNLGGHEERLQNLSPAKRQRLLELLQEEAMRKAGARGIPRRRDRGPAPLSFAQQRLWFLDRLAPGSPAYNLPFAVRLHGVLDPRSLAHSLNEIVRRHEALRARFEEREREAVQVVAPALDLPLPLVDLRELSGAEVDAEARRLTLAEARRPFDLERGPLLRAALLRRDREDHLALFTMHHIVSDAWSTANFVRELTDLYSAFSAGLPSPLPELPVQYPDYAVWQRESLRGDGLKRHLSYWRERLSGAPPLLDLPTDRPRPPVQSFRGATRTLTLDADLSEALRQLARLSGASLFMVLLAGFQALLARYSGQTDVLVGSPVANRTRPELEPLIGFFVNTLVLRADLSGDPGFRTLLGRVAAATLAAYDHQDLPFERLVDELRLPRSLGSSPLVQVLFAVQNAPAEGPISLGGDLRLSPWRTDSGTAQLDLNLSVLEQDASLAGGIQYSTDLFDAPTIERLLGHFARLLAEVAADLEARVGDLPLLGEAERHQVAVGWNDTAAAYPSAVCLHKLVEAQVERTPGAVAAVCDGESLTYNELARRAGRLARHLQALGVGPEVRVGLCAERSLDLVVGLLGILKAGGAYVPLDPDHPGERLAFLLEDGRIPVVLVQERFVAALPESGKRIVRLDADGEAAGREEAETPASGAGPDNLAYVIYTSGSTGRPKGAMNTHRAICNRLLWMQQAYGLMEADRVLQKTPFGFDVSVWELFWPLITGARLVLARPGGHRDNGYLIDLIEEQGITVLHFVPSMLQAFLDTPGLERCRSLRRVMASGEALPRELERRFRSRLAAELHNLYGPTEAAVDVSFHDCRGGEPDRPVPIGRPIANLAIHLLDAAFREVPIGVPGELCIGGVGLARGYLGRPDLTAERFVPHPCGGWPGARLYRTGDLARWLPAGEVEFLGRIDHQVKVRGFRIELGEIEATLVRHPGVREAVVLAREDGAGGKRLVAYVVGAEGRVPRVEALREHLRHWLPEHMVPAAFVELDALPLTPNGKLDRRALPSPGDGRPDLEVGYAAPRTPAEEVLCGIWGQVLGIGEVGVHDNFFVLGGDSILGLRAVTLARKQGLDLALADLFRRQTIAELAAGAAPVGPARDASAGRTTPFSLVSLADRTRLPAEVEDAYPLAMLQAGMLYHMALSPGDPLYHNVDSWHLRGRFEADPFQEAVRRVVARHPLLRTSFDLTGYSEPLQLVHRDAMLPVEVEDLRHLAPAEQERAIEERIARESGRLFDLTRPPQMRLHVAMRSEESFQLTLTENHAIADGWSLHSTLAEIGEIYFALLADEPRPEEPPPALTYRDFVHLERQALASAEAEAFWARLLADSPLVELPRWPLPSPVPDGPRVRHVTVPIPDLLFRGLTAVARRLAVPLKSLLLAAHCQVVGLVSGRTDVVTGLVSNGRPEEDGGDQIRGLFLNTLPFRLRLDAGTWQGLVERTFAAERELLTHRRYPFAALQRRRSERPLFEVSFNYIHFHVVRPLLDSGRIEVLESRGAEGGSFTLSAHFMHEDSPSRLALYLEYDSQSLPKAQIRSLGARYELALRALAEGGGALPGTSPLLSEAERHQILVEWNDRREEPLRNRCLPGRFRDQAARTPDRIAVVGGEVRLTYAELDRLCEGLARRLQQLGAGPEVRIAVALERRPELVIALLAVLRAGAAYVPLDLSHPAERLAFLVTDSGASVLLTGGGRAASLAALAPRVAVLSVEEEEQEPAGGGPWPEPDPQGLAYLIYTSGSTGRPKGVGIAHGGAAALVEWAGEAFSPRELEGVLASTSIGFDLSVFELFVPLCRGGTVILAENALQLPELPGRDAITLVNTVPSAGAELMRASALPPSVRTLSLAGEPLHAALVRQVYANSSVERVWNLYGPSEDTTYSTGAWIGPEETAEPSIGRPVAGSRAWVLDAGLWPLPVGVAGELCLGDRGVARGYLGRPDATAERFVPDPLSGTPGARLYRTGDLARHRPDGSLAFLGRLDHQVKIRGFRIEPGEVEEALARHPAVRDVVVHVWGSPEEKRLVAYVVSQDGDQASPGDLRAFLQGILPKHMIPAAFERLEALPRTPTGKVDRRSLPAPGSERPLPEVAFVPPRSEVERTLAALWCEVLQLDEVGVDDNFFDLGGDSLRLLRAHGKVRELYPGDLSIADFFRHPTIGSLAAHLAGGLEEASPAEQGEQLAVSRLASAGRQAELRRQRRAARQLQEEIDG